MFTFTNWLQNHLLPCPFKYITGIDCPGCGFQRSVLALIQGDFHKSFTLYPATLPVLAFFVFSLFEKQLNPGNSKQNLKKISLFILFSIIIFSYAVKICRQYGIYKASVWVTI